MHDGKEEKYPSHCFLSHDIYQCDKVWISLQHHHYHLCICKKWRCCNFHDHVDIIPPSDSSSRWTKNVWQAEKCSIRSRKEKKRHNPISKQSTVTRFNFEIKTHFFCTDFASKHWYLFILIIRNIGSIIFPIITWGKEVCLASAATRTRKQKAKKVTESHWKHINRHICMVPNKKPIWR